MLLSEGARTPIPVVSELLLTVSSLRSLPFPRMLLDRVVHDIPSIHLYEGFAFRDCSHSLLFGPLLLLATLVVPTLWAFSLEQLWRFHLGSTWVVTFSRSRYASRPNRSIDGRWTFTTLETRPCQPLQLPTNGDAADDVVAAPVAADDEAAGAETPNNQLPALLLSVKFLAARVRPRAIGIEFLPGTDVVHENTRGSF